MKIIHIEIKSKQNKSKQNKSKFQKALIGRGGVGMVSQLLMLSPKLPKTQIPYVRWGGGGGGGSEGGEGSLTM